METHKGKFVPTVRKFEIDESYWTPKTPVQPPLSHQMCQHNDNNILDGRGLENQLPNSNSQGMSTKMNYPTNLSFWKSSLPWSNDGVKEYGSGSGNLAGYEYLDHQLQNPSMSFGDLSAINGRCASYLPGNRDCDNDATTISSSLIGNSVLCNKSNLQQSTFQPTRLQHLQKMRDIFGEYLQSFKFEKWKGLSSNSCRTIDKGENFRTKNMVFLLTAIEVLDANFPQTTKHADRRNSTFAPTTPNSSWRIDNNVALGNSHLNTYQSQFSQHNVILKEDGVATMFNLHNVHEKVVADTADPSPSKTSVAIESHNHDLRGDQVIDLSKTPQTKPRRKRYQPKVLSEKKPRITPKPKTSKLDIGAKENVQAKRKYVRKNKVNISSTPPAEKVTTTREPTLAAATTKVGAIEETIIATKSCKKSLNFKLNRVSEESDFLHMPNGNSFSKPQPRLGENTVLHYSHIVRHLRHGEDSEVETSRGVTAYDLNRSSYQGLQICLALPAKDRLDISQSKNEAHLGRSHNFKPCKRSKEPEQTRGTKRDNCSIADVNVGSARDPKNESSRNETIGELSKEFIQNIGREKRTEKVIGAHASSIVTNVHKLDLPKGITSLLLEKPAPKGPHMKKINHDSLQPTTSSGIPTCIDALTVDSSASNIRSKRKSRKQKSSEQRDFILDDQSARAATDSNLALLGKNTNSRSIEEITRGLRLPYINRKGCKTLRKGKKALVLYHEDNQEQNALVAYEGNSTMVPFDGPSNLIKKRAKVDLDEETIKVWNLLVENIDNKGIDGSDEDKEKWWEKERSVFHGRVTSFIARLRLVQGDRRFTPWKGSILDSIIGVFLTQCVSDHLSSSTFMELAARFPPKLEGSVSTLSEESATAVNEEPNVTASQHSLLSSQNSANHPNLQTTTGVMNISSDSSARTQPLTVGTNCNYYDSFNSFTGLLKMADNPALFQSYYQTQLDPLDYMDWATEGSEALRSVCANDNLLDLNVPLPDTMGIDMMEVENSSLKDQSNFNAESTMQYVAWEGSSNSIPRLLVKNSCSSYVPEGKKMQRQSMEPLDTVASSVKGKTCLASESIKLSQVTTGVTVSSAGLKRTKNDQKKGEKSKLMNANASKSKKGKAKKWKDDAFDWDSLRREAQANGRIRERTANPEDSLDYEAVRQAQASEIAKIIHDRGLNHMLAKRVKILLDRLVKDHGSTDLEWLRDIPPDKAKDYLLSIEGLGLKSVECVRLLTLHHLAFPVDTHVARIVVRLGWVPLQPLPESVQLHLLESYPVLDSIQKYIWPRLCKLDQKTLYELHYHMITFGKVFCTKKKPNCNACPLRADCRHFASAYASARLALPRPEGESSTPSNAANTASPHPQASSNILPLPPPWSNQHSQNNPRYVDGTSSLPGFSSSILALSSSEAMNPMERQSGIRICEPIVEVPTTPEPEPDIEQGLCDIEDTFYEDPDEIPEIKLNIEQASQNVHIYMPTETSTNALALTTEALSIPPPKLKNAGKLRTEHLVYELPDTHPILKGLDKRVPDDPCSYLFVIWTPGETADSTEPPRRRCNSEDPSILCNEETCSYCNSVREANSQIARGTLLIPSRTAMRGNFPLNGTYFQVNEVFADHESSLKPISVPRTWLWNLPRRIVYFGTSTVSIFKGLTAEEIQRCFWRGYVCVRGFDHRTRAPRPLVANLHISASKKSKGKKGKAHDDE